MKIDVLIEYNPKLSEVTITSDAAQIIENKPARIGLSRSKHGDKNSELIEFVGEDWETIKKIEDFYPTDPTRNDRILLIVNPFELSTFDPDIAFVTIRHFVRRTGLRIYPKSYFWREFILLFDKIEVTLKIPGYNFFNPQMKAEFEKLLRAQYKHTTFIF